MLGFGSGSRRLALASVVATSLSSAGLAAPQQAATTLDDALRAAARQSGREIIYPADATKGRIAPVLAPNMPLEAAIRALLRGTGLEAEFRDGVIVLRQPSIETAEVAGGMAPEGATIVVTATRIRGERASSPVTVVERREIETAGLPDLGEAMRRLPQNFGGGQNPNVTGGGNQGANINTTSSSNVNLRGLGEDATLTLFNGHRVASDGINQGIDISAIPIAAISRIEVVADGASAIHGSDAVGGVVNVILRSDFSGLSTTARAGVSLDGGNREERLSAVVGSRWTSGGLMLAGDLNHNSAIYAGQRSYTNSLDPTLTLFPSRRQALVVAAAHQSFGIATLGLDAQYSSRSSETANPFFVTGPVSDYGLVARPTVNFYAFSPSVTLDLPGGWSANLTATQSRSVADLRNELFIQTSPTDLRLRYRNSLKTAALGAEGSLVRLPGGDLRLAAGMGLRSADLQVRSTSATGGIGTTTADYGGSQEVRFAYGEVSVPIIGPQNSGPAARRLTIDAAARYEDYRGLADILTPKIGIVYEPFTEVTIKGTWGRSFKAPTLYQQKQIRQSALIPGEYFVGVPADRTILLLGGSGNPLRPERAETWSGTLEIRPSRTLTLSASYYDVQFRDRVTTAISNVLSAYGDGRFADLIQYDPTAAQLNEIIATLPQGLSNQTGLPFDPGNVAAVINNGLQNLARQHINGVDVALGYRADLAAGQRVGITAAVTYLASDQRLSSGQAAVQRAGTIFDPPHWRSHVSATWERRGVTLAGFATYSGENRDDRYSPNGTVGSFVMFDASLRVRVQRRHGPFSGLEFGISILNLLDERPSPIPNLNPADPPYDSSNSSVLGRSLSISLTKAW